MQLTNINLLPYRTQRRLRRGWIIVSTFILCLLLVLVSLFYWVNLQQHKISTVERSKQHSGKELARLKQQVQTLNLPQYARRHAQSEWLHNITRSNVLIINRLQQLAQVASDKLIVQGVKLNSSHFLINGFSSSRTLVEKCMATIEYSKLKQIYCTPVRCTFLIEVNTS